MATSALVEAPFHGGHVTVVAYGRVPSNHEWGANGITGSFRFEQGNPTWAQNGPWRAAFIEP